MRMAEDFIPRLRVADWLDRAEAAQRQLEHLDLRDLRSVVAAADDPVVARDESTRELATALKAALVTKQDEELALWFADVEAALDVGRVVRALRLSSVPPKAGVPFPPVLAARLAEATTASLQPADGPDRWVAVLEAAAFSPVRSLVKPTAPPSSAATSSWRRSAVWARCSPRSPRCSRSRSPPVHRAEAAAPDHPSARDQEGRPDAPPCAGPTGRARRDTAGTGARRGTGAGRRGGDRRARRRGGARRRGCAGRRGRAATRRRSRSTWRRQTSPPTPASAEPPSDEAPEPADEREPGVGARGFAVSPPRSHRRPEPVDMASADAASRAGA